MSQPLDVDNLPPPECPLGYPWSQLERLLDAQAVARLELWMQGQTMTLCGGRLWVEKLGGGEWVPDKCAGHPHGAVVYQWDFERWLRAQPIID